ncbi:MAG: UDP-N-acetylmuramate dehydrogenase [Mycoplasmatales bacterium]
MYDKIIKEIEQKQLGRVLVNEEISKYTTIRCGGAVNALYFPNNIASLSYVIDKLNVEKIEYKILGRGSNVLFADHHIDLFVIKLSELSDKEKTKIKDNHIWVGAGYSLQKFAKEMSKLGYKGLEFAGGIPATIGGATFMNAGAHTGEMSDIINRVKTIDKFGQIQEYSLEQCEFSYRHSVFQEKNEVIIDVEFNFEIGDIAEVYKRMSGNLAYRQAMQPLSRPSFGSAFRNPEGYHSGKLIEECGLKGYQIGGAMISKKHANFIINNEDAKASEIVELIELVKVRVKEKFNVELETEVEMVGFKHE